MIGEPTTRLHGSLPEQSPPQPRNVEPDAGDAVSDTDVSDEYVVVQVLGQAIPDPLTSPEPVPARETVIDGFPTVAEDVV